MNSISSKAATPRLDAARLNGECYRILLEIENTAGWGEIPFSRIAQAFRLIDELMDPVLIPWDEEADTAITRFWKMRPGRPRLFSGSCSNT